MSDNRIYYLLSAIVIPITLLLDPSPNLSWIGVLMFKVIGPSVKRPQASYLRKIVLSVILIFLGPAIFGLFIGRTPNIIALLPSIAQAVAFAVFVLYFPLEK